MARSPVPIPLELIRIYKEDPRIVNWGIKNGLMLLSESVLEQVSALAGLKAKGYSVVVVRTADLEQQEVGM